jgi:hypothetical protein
VRCPRGRWGPRRIRVTECWAVVRAEDSYTGLLRDDATKVAPGVRGTVTWILGKGRKKRSASAALEIRPNKVWTRGRVFFECPRCRRRCTRLYLPLPDSYLACRRCWGLTYSSRTLQNYKNSLWGRRQFARLFGTTQREWAISTNDERRQQRLERSRERWARRRKYLTRAARSLSRPT